MQSLSRYFGALLVSLMVVFQVFGAGVAFATSFPEEEILECSPNEQTVNVGETVSFSVDALVGSDDRYYIWYAPGGNPDDAEGQNLDTFETSYSQAGNYSVTVFSLYFGNDASNCEVDVQVQEEEPAPQCSDDVDNADPEDELVDENDPGCHSDGNAENAESYVPTDNDETNSTGGGGGDDDAECEDNVDNNDPEDTLVDENDPGCHTDGDATDGDDTYNPNDDDEQNDDGTGGGDTECTDGVDNSDPEDELVDSADPGCHTDNNPNDADDSYDPNDDDETDQSSGGGGGGGSSRRSSGSRRAPTGEVLGAETSCGIHVDKYLRVGYANDAATVVKVQNFMNFYLHKNLAIDGIYGVETEAAVREFQIMHSDDVLDPWDIDESTGIFYLTTQTAVNNIMCPDLEIPIPNPLINWSVNPYVVLPPVAIA